MLANVRIPLPPHPLPPPSPQDVHERMCETRARNLSRVWQAVGMGGLKGTHGAARQWYVMTIVPQWRSHARASHPFDKRLFFVVIKKLRPGGASTHLPLETEHPDRIQERMHIGINADRECTLTGEHTYVIKLHFDALPISAHSQHRGPPPAQRPNMVPLAVQLSCGHQGVLAQEFPASVN